MHDPSFSSHAQYPMLYELDHLERNGLLERTTYGEWAAPIVAVPKRDGCLRLCGDYKVTVSPSLDVEQYPLPKPEDIFSSLSGGESSLPLIWVRPITSCFWMKNQGGTCHH